MRVAGAAAGRSSGAGRSQNPAMRLRVGFPLAQQNPAALRTTSSCGETHRVRSCGVSPAIARPCLRWRARQSDGERADQAERIGGRQTVAPSSISAWLKCAGLARGPATAARSARKRSRVRRRRYRRHRSPRAPPRAARCRRAPRGAGRTRCWRRRPRCNRRCRGARGWRRNRAGKPPAAADLLRGAAQVARARVVAEAAPQRQHVVFRGGGQGLHGGEAVEEALDSTGSRPARGSAAA